MNIDMNWINEESGAAAKEDHWIDGVSDECQAYYDRLRVAEPSITEDMKRLAIKEGFCLYDLASSVKTGYIVHAKMERRAAMLEEQGIPAEDDLEQIRAFGDIIRYTFLCEHDNIFSAIKTIICDLEGYGYTLYQIDNKWMKPDEKTGYKGIHMRFLSPAGYKFEIQVHSIESQTAKENGHELYKTLHDPNIILSEEERKNLLQESKCIYESIRDPDRIYEIRSFWKNPNKILESHIGNAEEADDQEEEPIQDIPAEVLLPLSEIDMEISDVNYPDLRLTP